MRSSVLAGVALFALLLGLAGRGRGDEEEDVWRTQPFKLRDRHAARLAVGEVDRLLAAGRMDAAARAAQQLLDEMPEDLYLVEGSPVTSRWRLAAEEVRDRLFKIAPDQREAYERFTAPSADPMLARAVARRRRDFLVEVVERYGASTAGREAARLLASTDIESGRLRDAVWWARQGLRAWPKDPVLLSRLVDALGLAGETKALERTRNEMQGDDALSKRIAAWLAEAHPEPAADRWPMWRGAADRDRAAPTAGPRPETLRWSTRVSFPPSRLDHDQTDAWVPNDDSQWDQWWATFRPLHAAVGDRTMYVANGRAVYAMDIYSDQRLWSFQYQRGANLPLHLVPPEVQGQGRTSFERAFAPVLSGDLVIATVEVEHTYRPEYLHFAEISTYMPWRTVVALDRRTGEVRWWMGRDPDDAAALSGTTISSPCVVADGLVVATTCRHDGTTYEVGLVALDATTGRLVWRSVLGVGNQELNLFGSPVKELGSSAPAVADGVVYATSGLGFLSALSLRTGRPVWVASYEIEEIRPVQFWFKAPLRWPMVAPSPPVVAGDLVLVAPTDGTGLHAFDRQTGALRWHDPYPRTSMLGVVGHFLGTANDGRRDVALMTGNDLEAFSLADGKRVWFGRLEQGYGEPDVPIGDGAVAGREVLVPTERGLAHFDLAREGAFLGLDPWPSGVEAGNVLPLPQVLVVLSRDVVQAFYSWQEIAKDVAARRAERPNDPTVLLEAGDIYRTGGALDRAERTFQEARTLAEKTKDAVALRRAEHGLFRTALAEADVAMATRPAEARAALARALSWARAAEERVRARLALDRALGADLAARAENLSRLVDEAGDTSGSFPGFEEEVPVRPAALLALAKVELEQNHPSRAVEALQRVLEADADLSVGGVPLLHVVRDRISEVIQTYGADAYAPYEAEARRLLATARDDDQALTQVLRRFPNATVMPEALYRLGKERADTGRPEAALAPLLQLLSEHDESEWAARGSALLAGAYDTLGMAGASRFTWTWLAARHGDDPVDVGGETRTGREAALPHLPKPASPTPPAASRAAPLEQTHFEPVAEGSFGQQVDLHAPPGVDPPVALLRDTDRLVAFDLATASVAFELEEGPCWRAAYDEGTLFLAFQSGLQAVDAGDGTPRWNVEVDGTITELETAAGQVFTLLQDTTNRMRTLLAYDKETGRELWRRVLDPSDMRNLEVVGTDLVLRETRWHERSAWPKLLVFDGLTGAVRNVVNLPPGHIDQGPVVVGRRAIFVARDDRSGYRLTGMDLDGVAPPWSHALRSDTHAGVLTAAGEDVVVLQEDGFLASYRGRDGQGVDETKILVGQAGARARPYEYTEARVAGDALVLMPFVREAPYHLGAWSRTTGKILWDHAFDEVRQRPSRAEVEVRGDVVLAIVSWNPEPGRPARVLLRRIALDTGEILQEIEPLGLSAEEGFLTLASGRGTVVVFGRSGAVVYAPRRD